jgi:hypothetical protein
MSSRIFLPIRVRIALLVHRSSFPIDVRGTSKSRVLKDAGKTMSIAAKILKPGAVLLPRFSVATRAKLTAVRDIATWSSILWAKVAAPAAEAMDGVFAGAEMGPAFCDTFVAVSLELVEVGINEAL